MVQAHMPMPVLKAHCHNRNSLPDDIPYGGARTSTKGRARLAYPSAYTVEGALLDGDKCEGGNTPLLFGISPVEIKVAACSYFNYLPIHQTKRDFKYLVIKRPSWL